MRKERKSPKLVNDRQLKDQFIVYTFDYLFVYYTSAARLDDFIVLFLRGNFNFHHVHLNLLVASGTMLYNIEADSCSENKPQGN